MYLDVCTAVSVKPDIANYLKLRKYGFIFFMTPYFIKDPDDMYKRIWYSEYISKSFPTNSLMKTTYSFGFQYNLRVQHPVNPDHLWSSGNVVARVYVCVCVCVPLCINHEFVRAITHHPFKLGSPNLDHTWQIPWLRPCCFGVIDQAWPSSQGQIWLEIHILPHFELVRTITHHPFKLG